MISMCICESEKKTKQYPIWAKTDGEATERTISRTRGPKGAVLRVCRKGERLGLMSVSDWYKRADKGGPNVRELVIQSLKDRH